MTGAVEDREPLISLVFVKSRSKNPSQTERAAANIEIADLG